MPGRLKMRSKKCMEKNGLMAVMGTYGLGHMVLNTILFRLNTSTMPQ
jgi:hypothetical protein